MTQHNAALVEETNATIAQTDGQVTALDGIVASFRLTADALGDDEMAWQQDEPVPQGEVYRAAV